MYHAPEQQLPSHWTEVPPINRPHMLVSPSNANFTARLLQFITKWAEKPSKGNSFSFHIRKNSSQVQSWLNSICNRQMQPNNSLPFMLTFRLHCSSWIDKGNVLCCCVFCDGHFPHPLTVLSPGSWVYYPILKHWLGPPPCPHAFPGLTGQTLECTAGQY